MNRTRLSPWPIFIGLILISWVALFQLHRFAHQAVPGGSPAGVFAAWALMTVAMMAPTAVPVLGALRDVLSNSSSSRPWWAFLATYLAVWLGFAACAAVLQLWLRDIDIIGQDGSTSSRVLSGSLLLAAGDYQFSPLKQRCLTECVNPMTFFLKHWREGSRGAVHMGLRHGVACLGCCWALMLLAFVGGVASIWFMAVATLVMIVEKLPAVGRILTKPLGIALLAAGIAVFAGIGSADGSQHHNHHSLSPHSPSPQSKEQPTWSHGR